MIKQNELLIAAKPRGFHHITSEIINSLDQLPEQGIINLFLQHTSCGLTINENCDPSVRIDFENSFNLLVKENEPFYTHTQEGPDDMPAHIKSTLTGQFLSIPITDYKLNLGTWQGIYLCEFRNSPSPRRIIVTVYS